MLTVIIQVFTNVTWSSVTPICIQTTPLLSLDLTFIMNRKKSHQTSNYRLTFRDCVANRGLVDEAIHFKFDCL